MKIGFPTHPRKDIVKEIEWIGRNKFDFVDIFLEEDINIPENLDIEKIITTLKKYNLDATGHTGYYLPFGSCVRSIREAAVNEAIRYLEVFSKLPVEYVTVHANWTASLFSVDETIDFQVESLRKLVKEAKKYNLNLMYESLDSWRDTSDTVAKVLKKVPGLYFHLDIGHTSVHGRKPEDFIRKFHKKLKHVHLHDNNLREDLHLPMGTGANNWNSILETLKRYYDGTITLEIFSQDKDYALLSKEKLRTLWRSL
ncbi:sugar phosphate isomerase/epimerase [Candidatus Woesearchaeota archaeon]|nr:sugar phosphate isomerase/epimerase [Candidatus Woesearchaeota archaeon]